MMPGMDPKMLKQAMKRMGIKQEELDAQEVIIKLKDKNLVFKNPQVAKINMMNEESFQVVGKYEEESNINEDDINLIIEQTNVSEREARKALEKNKGDIAKTILELKR